MDTALVTALTNFGALGVVLILILAGWLVPKPYFARLEEENRALREALAIERQRGTDAEQAGRVTTKLIGALTDLAAEKARRPPVRRDDSPSPEELR